MEASNHGIAAHFSALGADVVVRGPGTPRFLDHPTLPRAAWGLYKFTRPERLSFAATASGLPVFRPRRLKWALPGAWARAWAAWAQSAVAPMAGMSLRDSRTAAQPRLGRAGWASSVLPAGPPGAGGCRGGVEMAEGAAASEVVSPTPTPVVGSARREKVGGGTYKVAWTAPSRALAWPEVWPPGRAVAGRRAGRWLAARAWTAPTAIRARISSDPTADR